MSRGSEQVVRFMGRRGRAHAAHDQVQLAASVHSSVEQSDTRLWPLSIGESSPLNGFRYRDVRTPLRAVATQF